MHVIKALYLVAKCVLTTAGHYCPFPLGQFCVASGATAVVQHRRAMRGLPRLHRPPRIRMDFLMFENHLEVGLVNLAA